VMILLIQFMNASIQVPNICVFACLVHAHW